jgi:dihydrofolate reductase
MGRPVVVVTHSVPEGWPREHAPFAFVTDGIESAIEQASALAGDKAVGVNGGTIARQCLNAGLLDEIWVDLVPVLLGGGTPFFDQLNGAPVELEGPTSVVQGTDVTHLRYRVRYP